jgi:hypothetical protein
MTEEPSDSAQPGDAASGDSAPEAPAIQVDSESPFEAPEMKSIMASLDFDDGPDLALDE